MGTSGVNFENIFNDVNQSNLPDLPDGKLRSEDGRTFDIHKSVLAKNSQYFYAMFFGMGKGQNDRLIPGIKGRVLSNILSYIYTGNIHVSEENICDLVVASDYLLLDELLSRMKAYLTSNLSIKNCLPILMAALKINREDILKESFRFVQTHFEAIVNCKDSGFEDLTLEVLKQLLSDRHLSVRNELTVWVAIVKWIEADYSDRLLMVPDLLMYLTIADIDENIANHVLEHGIVAKGPICQEIKELKSSNPIASNLKILQLYFQGHPKPFSAFYDHRLPAKIHLVAGPYCGCFHNPTGDVNIYITYDEKIDLWHKILNTSFIPEFLLYVDDCIYMFFLRECTIFSFSLTTNQWTKLSSFKIERFGYAVVQLNGLIYILGGFSSLTLDDIYDVDVYDSEANLWSMTTPMLPVTIFAAVSLNQSIYVLGNTSGVLGNETIGQKFDYLTDTWSWLPALTKTRSFFTVVAYREQIFVIGGRGKYEYVKDVDVFDTTTNEWITKNELPYVYYEPKAFVINDQLIVSENHNRSRLCVKSSPPVQWNAQQECWESFEKSSPLNNLCMYSFSTLENNNDHMNTIFREKRNPTTTFEKSPFN